MKTDNKKDLFENMPVTKAILTLAIPTIISQLINVIYNIADTFYVGRTGNPYMIAGVSLALPVFLITLPIGNLCGIGGGSLVSRMMGAGKDGEAKSVSAVSIYASLLLSVIYSLLVYLFMLPILRVLGASDDTILFARQYTMNVVVYGTPFVVLSAVESHLLRNTGYSTTASIGLSGGGILNMILDPIFMFVVFPKGSEVLAAAVATLISNIAAFIFLTYEVIKVSKKSPLSLSVADLKKVKKKHISQICSVGIPSALLSGLFDLANIVLNSSMAAFGDLQLAAMGIVTKIERIPNAVGIGLSQGMLPLVAYNYSSGNLNRMRSVIKTARKIGIGTALSCIVLLEVFARPMTGIFLDTATENAAMTLVFAVAFLRLRAVASPFQFLNYHSSFCMQAIGDGKSTILHAVARILLIYIPLMLILKIPFGENGLAFGLPAGEFLSSFIALYLLRKHTKEKNI